MPQHPAARDGRARRDRAHARRRARARRRPAAAGRRCRRHPAGDARLAPRRTRRRPGDASRPRGRGRGRLEHPGLRPHARRGRPLSADPQDDAAEDDATAMLSAVPAEDAGDDGTDTPGGPPPGDEPPADGPRAPWWRRRAVLVPAGAVAVLAAAYGVDLARRLRGHPALHRRGRRRHRRPLPRGRRERAGGASWPRGSSADHTVVADDVEATLSPAAAGIALDVDGTVDAADDQPLNPWTRLVTLFSDREVAPVITGEETALSAQIETIAAQVDRRRSTPRSPSRDHPQRRRRGRRPDAGPRRARPTRSPRRWPPVATRARRSSCRWTSRRCASTAPRRSGCSTRRSRPRSRRRCGRRARTATTLGRGVGRRRSPRR